MIEGKLKNGFEFKIEDSVLDNMELVDAISEIDDDPTAISKVVKLLLGKDQRKSLYDSLRTKDGNVPIADVSKAVTEIFNSSKKTKN